MSIYQSTPAKHDPGEHDWRWPSIPVGSQRTVPSGVDRYTQYCVSCGARRDVETCEDDGHVTEWEYIVSLDELGERQQVEVWMEHERQ